MTFDYLFEAPQRWEKALDRGLFQSDRLLIIGILLFNDVVALADAGKHYTFTSAGLGIFLCFLFIFLLGASYFVVRLCGETRARLRSGFIDAESRRALLNVSYMGFRIYLIVLVAPALLTYAVLASYF